MIVDSLLRKNTFCVNFITLTHRKRTLNHHRQVASQGLCEKYQNAWHFAVTATGEDMLFWCKVILNIFSDLFTVELPSEVAPYFFFTFFSKISAVYYCFYGA